MRLLFVGMYPDEYNNYRNVFFQNLVFAMADAGVKCTVISPIPITKYMRNTKIVSKYRVDTTPKGASVEVYHPRYISVSSKKFGPLHTGRVSERNFQNVAIRTAQEICEEFDAVYGHFFLSGGLAAIKIARRRGIPSFVAFGECNYEDEVVSLYRELNEEDIKGLSGIIAVSTNNFKVLRKKSVFFDIPIIVAPNAVDKTLFHPMDKEKCRRKMGLPIDAFIVGFVGGFIERKGDKRLLQAIENNKDVYGAFAGRGENPPQGERVLFCDALEHDKVPFFLNALDVFCLPTQNEGSCNAVVEAASCGVPIISSKLPFNDDILTDDNSIRVNPNSVEEISDAIKTLQIDRALCNELAKECLESSKSFEISKRAEKILRFIVENKKPENR